MELEKAMKGSTNAIDDLNLEDNVPAISSSAVALQQAEVKKGMLHSLISSKAQASLKSVGTATQHTHCVMSSPHLLPGTWRAFWMTRVQH